MVHQYGNTDFFVCNFTEKTMRRIAIAALAIISAPSFAQNAGRSTPDYDFSPQVYSMVVSNNVQPDLNTGTLGLSIPLYTWADQDFELPVSISYSTNGFKPNSPIGILGNGWSLNLAGVITRQIIGNDDLEGNGYHYPGTTHPDAQDLYTMNLNIMFGDTQPIYNGFETTADVFHFSFGNHSGSFILNEDREFVAYNTNGEKGTYIIKYISQSQGNYFSIETSDGYIYDFGRSKTSREHLYNTDPMSLTLPGAHNYIVSDTQTITWHLDKITAPSGRIMEFNYISNTSYNVIPLNNESNPQNTSIDDVSTTFSHGQNIIGDYTRFWHASMTTVSYLKSISIRKNSSSSPTVIINLDYSYRQEKEVDSNDNANYTQLVAKQRKLDLISIFDHSGKPLANTSFSYIYKNNRMLLEKAQVSNVGTWNMEYNIPTYSKMPGLLSTAADFWGFYNGREVAEDCYNPMRMDMNYNEYIEDDYKNPNSTYSKIGTLKRLTSPTGGYTEFEYEANTAKYILTRSSNSSYIAPYAFPEFERDTMPSLGPVTFLDPFLHSPSLYEVMMGFEECGGVRIKSISEYDNQKLMFKRSFSYKNPGTNESSGIVLEFQRNYGGMFGPDVPMYNPNIKFPNYNLTKSHVAYSCVKETYLDGSYVLHRFTDYFDHPDEYSPYKKSFSYDYPIETEAYKSFVENVQREADSRHYRRGVIKLQEWYSSQGSLKRKKEYFYQDSDLEYVAYALVSGNCAWSARRFLCDFKLTMVKDRTYDGGELQTVDSYEYNQLGQIRKTTFSNSDGTEGKSTYYRYCHESNISDESPLSAAVSDVVTTVIKDGNEYVIDNVKHEYDTNAKNINPIKTTHYLITEPLLKSASVTFDNVFQIGRGASALSTHYSYDSNNRLIREDRPGNAYVNYIWDANGNNIVHIETNDAQQSDSYEWKDMVGITKHIFSTSQSETYGYDEKNRLKTVYDSNGSLIKKIDYHLENE